MPTEPHHDAHPAEGRARVLIVDEEAQIRRFLRISLEANGYRVFETVTGEEAVQEVARLRPDLVILDLELPDMIGFEVLRRIREWTSTPVIVLSVRSDDRDKIAALDGGADDYLTKPFSVDELMARLRVALRHAQPSPEEQVFVLDDLQVDLVRRLVTVRGEQIRLTPTEYALLRLMIQNAGKVLTHKQILRAVWGPEYVNETIICACISPNYAKRSNTIQHCHACWSQSRGSAIG